MSDPEYAKLMNAKARAKAEASARKRAEKEAKRRGKKGLFGKKKEEIVTSEETPGTGGQGAAPKEAGTGTPDDKDGKTNA